MPVTAVCNNSYIDDKTKKEKKCGEVEPYMDPKTGKVYCSKCDNEMQISHFQKVTMKTLKQFRQKQMIPFAVKCQNCGKEAQPKIMGDDIVCPQCSKEHSHLSEPFKIMLKDKLKTANKEL